MKLLLIISLISVAMAAQIIVPQPSPQDPSNKQPEVDEEKKITKRSYTAWDPWTPSISSHYTYSTPFISKVHISKPVWSSSHLSSGWYPEWYVGSPVILKSSGGWHGGWRSSGWKW